MIAVSSRRPNRTWVPEKQLGFPVFDSPNKRSSRTLSRWFKKAWPPSWGWGSWVKGCGCCSSPSSGSTVVGINITCCTNVPTTIHITFSNSGFCTTIDGQTFALTYSVLGNPLPCAGTSPTAVNGAAWLSTVQTCANTTTFQIAVFCKDLGGGSFQWGICFIGVGLGASNATSAVCSPLNIVFNINVRDFTGSCCNAASHAIVGTVTI